MAIRKNSSLPSEESRSGADRNNEGDHLETRNVANDTEKGDEDYDDEEENDELEEDDFDVDEEDDEDEDVE